MESNTNSTRRIWAMAIVILAAVVIGSILIRNASVDTDVTRHTTKVGLIINGSKADHSFCQTHYDALLRIQDALNLEIVCRENVPEDENSAGVIEKMIDEGCRFIIGASFGYGDYLVDAAKRHPEVYFLHPAGTEVGTNLSSVFGRMYQARYLSGIVAGMRTKSGELGFVAAYPYPEVIRGINAFTLGVRSVAPEARVYVRYCESWVDDAAAEKACTGMLDDHPGIDVLSMHTNSLKPNEIAEKRGIWSVGYNVNNASMFPESYLTACEWQWDVYYRESILSCLQGKFHGENVWVEMDEGIVELSELTKNAAPGTKEAVEEAKKRLQSRKYDVFYGPIIDNAGKLRVPKGESMSDEDLLNNFDWYVEGVSVEK